MGTSSRPVYEKPDDRKRQTAIVETVASAFGYGFRETDRFEAFDAELFDSTGEPRAIVEVKCRTIPSNRFETFLLCAEKFTTLRRISRTRAIPAILAVNWTDRLAILDLSRVGAYVMTEGGRKDRGDPLDIGPVVELDISSFWTVSYPTRIPR
jgi:hypothetical protein